jgi:uncharacterized protein YndB with AHSA1/START domain
MSSHTQATSTTAASTIVLEASVEEAFRVFVERFDQIKPREHNLLPVPIAKTILEPRVGGHLIDRGVDGTELRWGRVLAYEPPHRLLFSWNISPRWSLETDPDRASEVEVTFTAESAGRTRVAVEHRYLDRHGEGWQSLREGIDGDQGWPLYLCRFAGLSSGGS